MSETPTPRTDAAVFTVQIEDEDFDDVRQLVVDSEFAREQERAIAELVEALQVTLPSIIRDARHAWDTDQEMRVGKILTALLTPELHYRDDISNLHKLIAKHGVKR